MLRLGGIFLFKNRRDSLIYFVRPAVLTRGCTRSTILLQKHWSFPYLSAISVIFACPGNAAEKAIFYKELMISAINGALNKIIPNKLDYRKLTKKTVSKVSEGLLPLSF